MQLFIYLFLKHISYIRLSYSTLKYLLSICKNTLEINIYIYIKNVVSNNTLVNYKFLFYKSYIDIYLQSIPL